MDVIPAIDIRDGRCVRLVQGDYGRETVFADDPVEMARRWVDAGARRLHVVDLDGAKEGRPVNEDAVRRIITESGAAVQVAGGVRSRESIDRWAGAGAARIVVGTLAVEDPPAIDDAVRAHAGRIAIAVDVRDGRVATRGWLETESIAAMDFVREMLHRGARHFIYTDISRDGMMQHLDFTSVQKMLDVLREDGGGASMIYSGGVTSIDDLRALARYDMEGVIIGRALYEGRIDVREAIGAASGA